MHQETKNNQYVCIHVINFNEASGRFFFHFLEVFEKYIENIYFFQVNTKYISLNVLKISVSSRMHCTSEITDIFST